MAKNVLQKHWDGSKWVEIHPITKSTNVYSEDGKSIEQKFSEHEGDFSNPHNVTKAQVGLGNVDNIKQATKTEFTNHVNDTDNPHNVTKSQIGLGNVQNYSIATQAEAESGTATNRYMSPLRVKQAFEAFQDTYIEETGSNANGNYIRYENGIQICYGIRSVNITTSPSGALNLFHTDTAMLTLPAEFSSNTGASAFTNSQDLHVVSVVSQQLGVSNLTVRVWCSSPQENEDINVSFFVIGRWK